MILKLLVTVSNLYHKSSTRILSAKLYINKSLKTRLYISVILAKCIKCKTFKSDLSSIVSNYAKFRSILRELYFLILTISSKIFVSYEE